MKPHHCIVPVLASLLFCAALAQALAPPTPPRPLWIANPKSDDSAFIYRIGQASAQPSPETARAAAFQNALETLAREILTTLEIEGDQAALSARVKIQGAEILSQAVHVEQTPQGYSCWVQVAYPRSERNKVVEDIANGRELDSQWDAAQAAFARGDFHAAEEGLRGILEKPGSREYISFDLDAAKKMLADSYRAQKNYLEARHWYDNLAQLSESGAVRSQAQEEIAALPPPPIMWALKDRWKGRSVGLVCARRSGGAYEAFGALARVLRQESQQAEVKSADLTGKLDPAALAELFEVEDLSVLDPALQESGSGVVLAVLYDVDPAKSAEPGAIDTVVQYLVMDAARHQVVDRGQFKEMTGTQSADRMAVRCADILVRRYLAPRTPALE